MHNLYRIRQSVQVISFVLFICFLIYLDPLSERDKTTNYFLRISPLSAIGTMIAARELITKLWPAVIVVISTIILGRYFCSWICPFGTTIDITDKLLSKRRNKKKDKSKSPSDVTTNPVSTLYDRRKLKYYILIFLLVGTLFGIQMVGWFDPLSLVTNTYTILVHPYIVSIIDNFFYLFYDIPIVEIVIKPIHGLFKTILFALHPPFFRAHIIFLLIFMCIVSFGLVYRRYWCRNFCPLGALLALISDWTIFKRVVGNSCTSCRRCETECSMGAIKDDGKGTLEGECTLCLTCQKICPSNAIKFRKKSTDSQSLTIDLSKRKVLTAGFYSIASIPVLRLSPSKLPDKKNPSIIRPPGASTEDKFISKCLRCGECMRVCKTNGLHPVVFESAISDVWTPTLVPRLGYCDYECTLCGKVCPSGAIKRLNKEKKQTLTIGTAKINHNRCIPWVGFSKLPDLKKEWEDVNCAVCEEVCPIPTKAIRFAPYVVSEGKEIRRVYVDENICIGCGFCEKVCPVSGIAAIRVEGIQPQIISKSLIDQKTGLQKQDIIKYFPKSIGSWARKSIPIIYRGSNKLFEYINGGADPYLSYSFTQVAMAIYGMSNPKRSVKVDIWEFEKSDDAYGVFTKDRAGSTIAIGNEASIYDNYLWIWNGHYFITIEPQEGYSEITPDDTTTLGKGIVSAMPESSRVVLPTIVNLMPEEGLNKGSIKFFHEKIILDNIYILNQFIEENLFILDNKTDCIIGEYKTNGDSPPLKLMIVKYRDDNTAIKAYQNLINLRKQQGEKLVNSSDHIKTFIDSDSKFCSLCKTNSLLIVTFFAPSRHYSERYIDAVLTITRD